jgi:hypothetical protein
MQAANHFSANPLHELSADHRKYLNLQSLERFSPRTQPRRRTPGAHRRPSALHENIPI